MPAKTVGAAILPYRDENNQTVRYVPAPAPSQYSGLMTSSPYDSDFEPLITSTISSDLDEDALMHFTATGRPVPAFKASSLANLGGAMYLPPQLLPKRYTDDSLVPAIVTDVIPSQSTLSAPQKKKSLLGKLKGKKQDYRMSEKGLLKVVMMPRREYQKHFAKDLKGIYIGTEPYRRWTEEELEERFGMYKPEKVGKGGKVSFGGYSDGMSHGLRANNV